MKYEEFIKDIQRGIEKIVKERLEDGVVVIRNVTKNNGVSMKAVSILRKGENATPTIYLKEYYREYKCGRHIESICNEIFDVYIEGISRFKNSINIREFSDFEQVREKVFYKLINYDLNEKLLMDLPHFKYLDMAVIFFIMINCDANEQATALIHNQHMENWNISSEELKKTAFNNTWKKYPAVIRRMEDVISDMIMGDIMGEKDGDYTDSIKEDFQYGSYDYEEVESIVKEEVENLKAEKEMDMYVLTNEARTNGAACITYPGVIKDFAKKHDSDIYIIPSSIHEVILIPGTHWEKEKINEMIMEVNKNELDPVEVLSDHVYIFNRDDEEIHY